MKKKHKNFKQIAEHDFSCDLLIFRSEKQTFIGTAVNV